MTEYNPDLVYPPGEHILEILSERNLTTDWLQEVTGIPDHDFHELIVGLLPITIDIAGKLEQALGVDQSFWLNLEKSWNDFLSR